MINSDQHENIRLLLEAKYTEYNTKDFILTDPVQIPHSFEKKEDIEIASFLTCTIAWGQRKTIINNAFRLMTLLDNSPHEFLLSSSGKEWNRFGKFVHRTFQSSDLMYFLDALKRIYTDFGGLEEIFNEGYKNGEIYDSINHFRRVFMQWSPLKRVNKHVSNLKKVQPRKGLTCF